MRQTTLHEMVSNMKSKDSKAEPPARVTRGSGLIAKEQIKEVEEPMQEEQNEEQSQKSEEQPPKTKKIHHMTLKAMQRKAELEAMGIEQQKVEPVKTGRKVGRPRKIQRKRNFKKAVQIPLQAEEKSIPEVQPQAEILPIRRRGRQKKIIPQNLTIIPQTESKPKPPLEKQEEMELINEMVSEDAPKKEEQVKVPPVKGKRGRKKKVVVQAQATIGKVYTVPKVQTYENYNRYYDKILEQSDEELDRPLIFDKFMDPRGYNSLLSFLNDD